MLWLIDLNFLNLGWVASIILEWAPPLLPDLSVIVLNSLVLLVGAAVYWWLMPLYDKEFKEHSAAHLEQEKPEIGKEKG
ncbi:MAG: hypothetical protein R6U96_05155 [Promethearchaeia archaeon]